MLNYLDNLPRVSKRLILIITDIILLPLALWASYALRLSEWWPNIAHIKWALIAAPLVAIPIFIQMGLYRSVVRYIGGKASFRVMLGVTLAVIGLFFILSAFLSHNYLPKSVYGIFWAFSLVYIGSSRFLARYLFQRRRHHPHLRQKIVIYGAGDSGAQLALGLHNSKEYQPIAFIDDKRELQGSVIHDLKVFAPSVLESLIKSKNVVQVLLAVPSASRARRQEILQKLEPFQIHIKTVPSIATLISGKALVDEIQEVDIEDLLGRDPIPPNMELLCKCIAHKVVMVTGAGGSIGAELCRQIITQNPLKLILFEVSEFGLYQIEQELESILRLQPTTLRQEDIIPILGSITDKKRLEKVINSFKVQTIYHAAAYKHVPLVEQNPIEGIFNNVFGTLYTAEAAKGQVETFVLISTDKAVRPTSVMGASKRVSELILQGISRLNSKTRFCMVRFGNVLGSSGSVVPLFRQQIRQGGPLTVTDPEISRYFMTIPEAAQLVLQAGAMAKGGDVFVLDMAKPIKILDLARRMIRLSGLEVRDADNPEGDVEIKITGLRPGEKLFEELLLGNHAVPTEHPRITRAEEHELPWPELTEYLNRLVKACQDFNCDASRKILMEIIDEYTPQCGIKDQVWHLNQNIKLASSSLCATNEPIAVAN